ncbi:phosphoribosyl-AMP cyclohydrolase [Kordiimonas sediminis]|uniref:Phosphoribosyl-AMP cyclohydrolase n=1 Tax=Kordiimonas sediminis TaxID=1735581 RepID=A0A919ANL3_9PROT|nr:phosphoribosyl-AMP cyclohydrolase [Kordiimonas sediminis]GHF17223.1 phosphoribosyl-AMP cyclohydrolase [Kordiimonas sediminis]
MPATLFGDRTNKDQVENGLTFAPKFDDRGLIPVVTTCAATGQVLMQAWMNADAIRKTIETGEAHYFSRSRQQLWHKGATSGEYQIVHDFRTDCDQDSLLLVVEQKGGKCCHVGHPSCFYRSIPIGHRTDGLIQMTPAKD